MCLFSRVNLTRLSQHDITENITKEVRLQINLNQVHSVWVSACRMCTAAGQQPRRVGTLRVRNSLVTWFMD